MFLKELEIYGFKSFPKRTKFSFNSGITAIVGPNGCGKSNIADAVRWVLGEQNIRSLRGKKLTDIIYTGNHSGKPLNLAEVSLIFDNSQKIFPLEREEISVKRRIYRSGETENFINGLPCRLKEIQNLLLNTGLGKNTYSMIAQGEIDIILNAKPSDRRYLFEEAALISRYKYEKQNTIKKIEETSKNLEQVKNILAEIKNQLDILEEEANQLYIYKDYKKRIKEYELFLLWQRYHACKTNFQKIQINMKTFDVERTEKLKTFSDCEKEIKQLKEEVENQKKQLEIYQTGNSELQQKCYDIQNHLNIEKEKKNELNRKSIEINRDIRNTKEKIKSIENNNAFNQKRMNDLSKSIDSLYNEQENRKNRLNNLKRKVNTLNSLRNYCQKMLYDLRNKDVIIRDMKIKIETTLNILKNNFTQNHKRKLQIENDLQEIVNTIDRHKEITKKEDIDNLDNYLAKNEQKLKEIENNISKVIFTIEKNKQMIHLKDERILLAKKAIQDIEAGDELQSKEFFHKYNHEYSDDLCEKMINAIEDIPADMEKAIEIALHDSLDTIIVGNFNNAIEIIHSLSINYAKDLKIISLDRVKKIDMRKKGIDKDNPDILGFANDMINCPEKYNNIFNALLGDTVIVRKNLTAIDLLGKYAGKYRLISLEGMIIRKDSTLYFCRDNQNKKDNLFRYKKEKNQLIEESKKINDSLKENQELLKKNNNIYKYLMQENAQLKRKINESKNRNDGKNENIKELNFRMKDLKSNLNNLTKEEKFLSEEIKQVSRKLSFYEYNYRRLHQYKIKIEDSFNTINQKIRQQNNYISDIEKDINSIKNELIIKKERIHNSKDKEKDIQVQLEELEAFIQRKHSENQENDKNQQMLLENIESCQKELNILKQKTSNDQKILGEIKQNIRNKSEQLERNLTRKEEIQESYETIKEQQHREELVKVQYGEKYESIKNEATKDYQISLEGLEKYKNYCTSRKEASQQINDLRENIIGMGQINFDAGNRYQQQLDRFNNLNSQYNELIKGKESLLRLVSEIDNIATERFKKTFNRVNLYFNEIFQSIFSGGEATLKLTIHDDIAQSEIDIIASPPGKQTRNIELLSSGEKALTAIALLLALWKVNPSPFCFFDEIDTALDETNAERLSTILKGDDLKKSQLIIITHQKSTMEAADTLCGITMQESGISKLVSVKLTK